MNQQNQQPAAAAEQQPKKHLTAAQRLEGLEMSFRLLDQEVGRQQNLLSNHTQAIVLLSKKLEAVKRATGTTDDRIAELVMDQDLEEMRDKVKEKLEAGIIKPSESLDSEKGFVVIRVSTNDMKSVVNQRMQFPMFNQHQDVKSKFEGKKVGDLVVLEDGGKQHEILEIYEMIVPKAPADDESGPDNKEAESAAPEAPTNESPAPSNS